MVLQAVLDNGRLGLALERVARARRLVLSKLDAAERAAAEGTDNSERVAGDGFGEAGSILSRRKYRVLLLLSRAAKLGDITKHRHEVLAAKGEEFHPGACHDGCRALVLLKEGELTEDAAGTDLLHNYAVLDDFHRASLDDVKVIAHLALADNRITRIEVLDLQGRGKLRQLVGRNEVLQLLVLNRHLRDEANVFILALELKI
mmetsp:Transcript_22329/g.51633  ORF Transcript_22329/g.51633 Transcript_22329/m.51633 type:complete len:203 (+) Transcript_22329:807-1415(+)